MKRKTTFTYKLKYPVKHNGHEIKEITIRRPTVSDQIEAAEKTKDSTPEKQTLYLYSLISGLSPEELGRVDAYSDWINFLEESGSFLNIGVLAQKI